MNSIGEALRFAIQKLGEPKKAEAEHLVCFALEKTLQKSLNRMELFLRAGEPILPATLDCLREAIEIRLTGIPLHHITEKKDFFNHTYLVNPDVLIPRPETEALVETALRRLRARTMPEPLLGFEIGIGSGAISIELLAAIPTLRVAASEVSQAASAVAAKNATQILDASEPGTRLKLLPVKNPSEVFEAFESVAAMETADFIISNPPYLDQRDEIDPEVMRHEPHLALFPPDNPLYFYCKIASEAARFLERGGECYLEIPHNRWRQIEGTFKQEKWETKIFTDLTGRERILVAVLKDHGTNQDQRR